MGGKLYTHEQIGWFKDNSSKPYADLTAEFNSRFGASKSQKHIRAAIARHCPESLHERFRFTPEQKRWIEEHIDGCPHKELAERFNERFGTQLSTSSMSRYASKHGLSNGIPLGTSPGSRWQKFGPGHKTVDAYCPVGFEQIESSAGQHPYVRVKVSEHPSVWRRKHCVVWEAANGPVPEGHRIEFLDGNPLNCELDNLQLVGLRQGLILRNYGIKAPSPTLEIAEEKEKFVEFVSAKAAMQRNAREKRKALRDKKQEACKNG
jgi:hypothetical protein